MRLAPPTPLPLSIDLFKSQPQNRNVKPGFVRTSIDIPRDLHVRLHEAAARRGCSARQLILKGVECAVAEASPVRPCRRLSLDRPIVPTRGKPFDLTEEQIYEIAGLP
jgi:hypothetical protein